MYKTYSKLRLLNLLLVPVLVCGMACLVRPAEAQIMEPIISGYGTATVDGQLSQGEWEAANVFYIDVNVPPEDGGGTIPVEMYLMNDNVNKYFAFKIGRSPILGSTNPVFQFDVNNNGLKDVVDEHFGMSVGLYSGARERDGFYTNLPPCPSGSVCGFSDTDYGGTNDVVSKATVDEESTYIEISHPLDSDDDLHDMNVGPGDIVGFSMSLRLFSQDTACNYGWDCMADTRFPAYGYQPIQFGSANQSPIANPGSPYYGTEGYSINLDGSGSYDPDGDALSFHWSIPPEECEISDPNSATPKVTCYDDGVFTGILTVDDGQATDWDTARIYVENAPPSVGSISAEPQVSAVGTQVLVDADFSDNGRVDTHSALWDWGDGSQSLPTELNQEPGGGEVFGSHVYTSPGVYTIQLTVTDDDGGSGSSDLQNLVVYDPDGGFVTGGGWIWSYSGTYVLEPDVTGWANFGFVAKYHKGAELPDGQVELVYHTAGMNFHSEAYDWMVVNGDGTAKFKGRGSLNGEGDYKFMIWASDGEPDTFRIKIWEEVNGEELVIYDNSLGHPDFENGQPIGNGNILIQAANSQVKEVIDQYHKGFMLGYWLDADDIRWQEFTPSYDNLSAVEVYLGKDGNPGNVIVEIRNLEGTILEAEVVSEADIHKYGWVKVAFSMPIPVTPGTKYRIYVYADQVSDSPENRYYWFGDRDSPYDSGCETDLYYFMPDFDYAFKTFAVLD